MTPDRKTLGYAFQFDALLYAAYLRTYAEARGVNRIEGKVVSAAQDAEGGFVTSATLADGQVLGGRLSGAIGIDIHPPDPYGDYQAAGAFPAGRLPANGD